MAPNDTGALRLAGAAVVGFGGASLPMSGIPGQQYRQPLDFKRLYDRRQRRPVRGIGAYGSYSTQTSFSSPCIDRRGAGFPQDGGYGSQLPFATPVQLSTMATNASDIGGRATAF